MWSQHESSCSSFPMWPATSQKQVNGPFSLLPTFMTQSKWVQALAKRFLVPRTFYHWADGQRRGMGWSCPRMEKAALNQHQRLKLLMLRKLSWSRSRRWIGVPLGLSLSAWLTAAQHDLMCYGHQSGSCKISSTPFDLTITRSSLQILGWTL